MTKSMIAAAALCNVLTVALASEAKSSMARCPAPEITVNAGTRSQACRPSAQGKCAAGHTAQRGECVPQITTLPSRPTLGGKPKKAACPSPEKVVNAGSRSQYCAPMGRRCGEHRLLTKSKILNKYVCEPVRVRKNDKS